MAVQARSADERMRDQPSPRQRRWIVWCCLPIGLCNAALAVAWANDRAFHAIIAALWVLTAVGYLRKKLPLSLGTARQSAGAHSQHR